MKRIIIAVLLAIVCMSLNIAPILADDPPDTEVEIGIGSPGDVDVEIDINSGGSSMVTIDGTSYPEAIDRAVSAATSGGAINSSDWWRYKAKYLDPLFAQLYGMLNESSGQLNISMKAIAKLIQDTDNITKYNTIQDTKMLEYISALQLQDDKTWNQLMYGAEAHIDILTDRTDNLASDLAELQEQSAYLQQQLDVSNGNMVLLSNHYDYAQKQYLYYLCILGGCCVALFVISTVLMVRVKKLSR
jgi:hypothetical protein